MKEMKDLAIMAAVVLVAVVAGGLVLSGLGQQPQYAIGESYAPSYAAGSAGMMKSGVAAAPSASSYPSPYGYGEQKRLISSSGTVVKSYTPDEVKISFAVETLDKSATQSQIMNADISKKMRDALKAAGVADDEIETTSYNLSQNYEWNELSRKSELTGYRTSNNIVVTLHNTQMTGKVIDAGVRAGANRVNSVQFSLSRTSEAKARAELLSLAASSAKNKAERIASGFGTSIARLNSASEGYSYVPVYNAYYAKSAGAMDSAPAPETPISAGDVIVSVTVDATFEIN